MNQLLPRRPIRFKGGKHGNVLVTTYMSLFRTCHETFLFHNRSPIMELFQVDEFLDNRVTWDTVWLRKESKCRNENWWKTRQLNGSVTPVFKVFNLHPFPQTLPFLGITYNAFTLPSQGILFCKTLLYFKRIGNTGKISYSGHGCLITTCVVFTTHPSHTILSWVCFEGICYPRGAIL